MITGLIALSALTASVAGAKEQVRENKMAEPARPEALSLFVGTWHTTGATRAKANAPSERIDATDRYEWMEGRFFLLHHVDARTPHATKALEIIGPAGPDGGFPTKGFGSEGQTFAFTYELDGRTFRNIGPNERFAGAFTEDGETLSGTWERSEDGRTWKPWKNIKLTKVRAR